MGSVRPAGFAALALLGGCAIAFPDGKIIDAALLLKLTALSATEDGRKFLFVTTGTHNGNFATGFANGIAGADAFCATQKNTYYGGLPGTSYKALLVDSGTNRRACSTSNCAGGAAEHVDWVLAANTTYYLPDGSKAFTTDATGILVFNPPTVQFSQALAAATGTHWWTGMFTDWVVQTHCTNWSVTAGSAEYGRGTHVDSGAISFNADLCTALDFVVCIRQ